MKSASSCLDKSKCDRIHILNSISFKYNMSYNTLKNKIYYMDTPYIDFNRTATVFNIKNRDCLNLSDSLLQLIYNVSFFTIFLKLLLLYPFTAFCFLSFTINSPQIHPFRPSFCRYLRDLFGNILFIYHFPENVIHFYPSFR